MNRGILYIKIFILFIFLAAPLPQAFAGSQAKISFVVTKETKSVLELKNILIDNLHYQNVNVIQLDAVNKFGSDKNHIYIAVGSIVLDHLIKAKLKNPIIAILIPRIAYHQTLKSYKKSDVANVSAIFIDPSPLQQMALIKSLYGKYPRIGILISEKTKFIEQELIEISKKMTASLDVVEHLPNNDIHKTLKKLDNIDVLLAFPDSNIYNENTLKKIILSTYRRGGYGIVGFSPQLVKAGCIATIYYDQADVAKHLDKVIDDYMRKGVLLKPSYPENFSLKTNHTLGRSLNVIIPEDEKLMLEVNSFLERKKYDE